MASSDEYQQIQFWEKLKKKKTFCEEVKLKLLKEQVRRFEIIVKRLEKKNDTRNI